MPVVSLLKRSRLTALLLAVAISTDAGACPAGQSEVCVVTCFCAPGSKEELEALTSSVNQLAASNLQRWLEESRNSASVQGVEGIPLHIRAALESYYDLQVLDAVRYQVGNGEALNAANSMLQNPDVNAVTLLDIIVFRHAEDAQNNVALWAHELKHVQQYQQWGAAQFASNYTRDYRSVEAPAYAIQSQVERALRKGSSAR